MLALPAVELNELAEWEELRRWKFEELRRWKRLHASSDACDSRQVGTTTGIPGLLGFARPPMHRESLWAGAA